MESLKRRFIYTESPTSDVFYYGTGTTTGVTASYILSTFSTATGYVGSLTGRPYTFGTTFGTYRYWAIPDVPDGAEYGYKIIAAAKYSDGNTTLVMQPPQTFYSYYQDNPQPAIQSIQYGKLDINGVTFRLYRTTVKYNSANIQFLIYSFS